MIALARRWAEHCAGQHSSRPQPLGRPYNLRPAKIQRVFGKRTPCKAGAAVADPRSRSLQDMHISIPGITSAGQVRFAAHTAHTTHLLMILMGARCQGLQVWSEQNTQ